MSKQTQRVSSAKKTNGSNVSKRVARPNCNKRDKSNSKDKGFESSKDGVNDPSWYNQYPELVRDAASIPFSWSTGNGIDMRGGATMPYHPVVPGILTMEVLPSFGYTMSNTDPVNAAATSLYSFVRHANSGSANYDAPDLMLYILAMSQVYSAITFCERLYGCATLFSQRNRYLPRALVRAQNVDYDSIASHLADFRYEINLLINKAASFSVPKNMTLFNRHAFLYQNVYTEGDSPMDQIYMFIPKGFYIFKDMTSTRRAHLEFVPETFDTTGNPNGVSYKTITYEIHRMIDSLMHSEDMNIMSGDILKAYTAEGCIKLMPMPEVYPLVPIRNDIVLEQMMNATLVGDTILYDHLEVSVNADTNALQCPLKMDVQTTDSSIMVSSKEYQLCDQLGRKQFLNTQFSEVTPDLVMELTRLKVVNNENRKNITIVDIAGKKYYETGIIAGSEVALVGHIWVLDESKDKDQLTHYDFTSHTILVDPTVDSCWWYISLLNAGSAFKYLPVLDLSDISSGSVGSAMPNIRYSKYAVLDRSTIQRLHEAALFSELYVPIVNRF